MDIKDIELDGGELDTLYQLVMNGPLESGCLPSKTGFANLCKRGLANRDVDTWLGYVSQAGLEKFKELEWRGFSGEAILDADKSIAVRCRQDPNDNHPTQVVEMRTVKDETVRTVVGKL